MFYCFLNYKATKHSICSTEYLLHFICSVACALKHSDIEVFSLVFNQMWIPVTLKGKVSVMESSKTRSAQYAPTSSPLRASCRSISVNMRSTIRLVRHLILSVSQHCYLSMHSENSMLTLSSALVFVFFLQFYAFRSWSLVAA